MTYKVVLLSRAETELADIAVWLSERSPDGAIRWLDAFDAARQSLSANPSANASCNSPASGSHFAEATEEWFGRSKPSKL